MIIKKNNGRRIKSCDRCSHVYITMYWIGCIEGLHHTDAYRAIVDYSWKIPIECRLPNWKRTLPV